MAIWSPRIFCVARSSSFNKSTVDSPSGEKSISPAGYRTVFCGRSFRIESAVTDFPDPDSPTIARISPLFTSALMSLTAVLVPISVSKSI